MIKIVGHIVSVPKNLISKLDTSIYEIIGTKEEIIEKELFDRVLVNSYVDYLDLSKEYVSKKESFLSWYTLNEIPESSILASFSKFNGTYHKILKMPKTAKYPAEFYDIFERIDPDVSEYLLNKHKVPLLINGYKLYNLQNHKIKPNIYYTENGVVRNTSVEINKMNVVKKKSKHELYKKINLKKLTILNYGK
jgi:hypothetical protein